MNTRTFPARALLAALALPLLVTACGDDTDTETTAGTAATDQAGGTACDDIEMAGAFVRLPGGDNTAVYVDLTNDGQADTALVGAAGDFAEAFELHEMVADDQGVMEMLPIEGQRIELASGETVQLEPGGLHVMALGVTEDLAEGDMVEVDLEFEDGCTTTLTAEVRAADDEMGGMGEDTEGMEGEDMSGG